jgi:hypothetical protein
VNDQQGKTYLVFPTYMTSIQAPLLRLIGSTGPEVINYQQVGTANRVSNCDTLVGN